MSSVWLQWAQSVYAMRVLRTRVVDDDALQHIFRATVVARLTYATSVWHGLTKASDRKHIDSVLGRAQRYVYYLPTFDEICNAADDELFGKAMRLSNHVLRTLIPSQISACQRYNLRVDIAHAYYSCYHTPRACQTLISLYGWSIKKYIRHISLDDFMLCTLFCVLLACVV